MNRATPHRLTAAMAFCLLAVIFPATGCGGAAPRGSPALGAGSATAQTGTTRRGEAADRGIVGCAALLGPHQAAARNYPKIRSQFARSHWPDLRIAGVAYAELAVQLHTARADGYQTVWFYQRLSLACAKHGWKKVSLLRAG